MHMTEQKLHTVVIMGGWSHEREVSMRSGTAVYENIDSNKYRRRCLQILNDRQVKLLSEETGPEDIRWEDIDTIPFLDAFKQLVEWNCHAAVLALHGEGGEDGVIQGFLETLGIPYTHSDVRGSAVAMDKEFSKYVYQARGIPTPGFAVISQMDDADAALADVQLSFPIVAKPTILRSFS